MKQRIQRFTLVLALLMLLSVVAVFSGCSNQDGQPTQTEETDFIPNETESEEVDNRFVDVDYKGREFRIYTSANAAYSTLESSNFFIEGTGETGGGLVSDAVFERNLMVEDLLKVELVFTRSDYDYKGVAADIRKLATSATDEYDLVINDIYGLTPLIAEGCFRNVLEDEAVFDFDRPYWYKDFMEDMRLMNGYQYVLAGDFFIDVLRTAHILLMNKQMYTDYYQRPGDEIYDIVLNYEWTYEKMNEIISGIYDDKDLDGEKSAGDIYGYMDATWWGGSIPYSISSFRNVISRDEDGIPTVTIQEGDRANQLVSAVRKILGNESTFLHYPHEMEAFTGGNVLITGFVSLGSLELDILRGMEAEAAVLPYPMLYASDKKYTTSAHDTTEMGVILTTSKDLEYISTVVEVLNRETARILLPEYYDEALKLQLVDDEKAGAIIDIIHDNFDNSFALAYNTVLGGAFMDPVYKAAMDNREYYVVYKSYERNVERTLTSQIKAFMKNNGLS